MNPILEAINAGYSEDDVLQYVARIAPKLVPKINKAVSSGYKIKEVLGYLAKSSPQNTHGMSESQIHSRNRQMDTQLAQKGLVLATTALASPAANKALSSALSRSLPQSLKQLAPSLASQSALPGGEDNLSPATANPQSGGQQPTTLSQPQTQPSQPTEQSALSSVSQQPPSVNNVTSVTQPTTLPQSQGIINPKEYLDKLGITDKVDSLLKAGNTPEGVAAAISVKRSGEAKIDPELVSNIDAYSKEAKPETKLPHSVPEEKTQDVIEPVKIAKSETVSTPHGIGEVREIRNGQAIIDVGGKLHKVKEEELEASPIPEKDLAELHDDLLRGIESETGEDVSRMVQWAGYNPETNTLQFLPHTGKLYKYSNISSEDAALLTDILSTRKTSGENFIGVWKAGSKSPIGAALSKLIRKLQSERGGKGNEYEETHEPIYSAYEPAIQAKRKKKKK